MEIEGAIILNIVVFIIGLIYGRIIYGIKGKRGGKFVSGKRLEKVYTEFTFASLFLIGYNSLNPWNINAEKFELYEARLVLYTFMPLMLAFMYLTSNFEMLSKRIDKGYLIVGFGIILSYLSLDSIFRINSYEVNGITVYPPVMFMVIIIMLIILQMVLYAKREKTNYVIDVIMYMYIISIFAGSTVMIISIPIVITFYLISVMLRKHLILNTILKNGERKITKSEIRELEKKEEQKGRGIIAITPIISWTVINVYIAYNYYIYYILT